MSESIHSSTGTQFDLTVVGNEDTDRLAQEIEGHYKKDTTAKQQLAYNWERNQLMLDGKQWIVYDGQQATGGLWKRLEVSQANEYIPRPVTNYLFDVYQTLKSYVIKNKPRSTVYPNTSTFQDRSASKIADLCLEANWERLREQANYEYAAACLVTYGTVFKKDFWDTTELMSAKVPKMTQMPKMDPQTGQVVGMEEVQAKDPQTGEPLFDFMPLGDCNTDVVEPYRIAMDPLANDPHKARWIMEYSIQSLAWIKSVYGKEGDGYTGQAEEVEEETQLSGSLRKFYQMKTSSGVKDRVEGAVAGGSSDESLTNSAVVKEYYERPSKDNPQGRMVVVANGKTLYAGASPYVGPELGDWHPYSECRWEIVPGRFWGKSPLDAACEIQRQVNSIDATIILTRKTMAIPQKLIPTSAGLAHGAWTGRPGQMIYYRDSGGAKPEIIPPAGVDGTVFQERAQRVEDIKTVSGAIDILKGDRPNGVTAASALELLYEVGTGKLFPILDRWKYFVESSQKKQLKIIAKFYKEPRPEFIRLLRSKNKELSEQAISQFIGADLYDNCNVIVEAGSNITKLQAAKKQELREAAQAGVLGLEQPQNRAEYQRQMGIAGFDSDIGPDEKRAEWENALLDNISNSPDNHPIRLDVDNDDIHMSVMAKRMKEPSWMELDSQAQQAYMQHYQEHMQSQQQKQQAQMMQAMAMGGPQGGGPGPGTPSPAGAPGPSRPHPAGHGPTNDVKNDLASDLHTPGSGIRSN
jgi:hypothetical protein